MARSAIRAIEERAFYFVEREKEWMANMARANIGWEGRGGGGCTIDCHGDMVVIVIFVRLFIVSFSSFFDATCNLQGFDDVRALSHASVLCDVMFCVH